ncbi:MAG: FG-GAP-like repeat-containing protein [Candidatus Binatia bacterium]
MRLPVVVLWAGLVSSLVGPAAVSAITVPLRLTGQKLLLKDRPGDARRRDVTLVSRDGTLTLGRGNGSADDPVEQGASLRFATVAGDRFDVTYRLPKAHWRYLGHKGEGRGYRFTGLKPFRSVVVKTRRTIRVRARGAGLLATLGADPTPVDVVLTLGEQRYCLRFGGTTTFVAGRKFLAQSAPTAAACAANDAPWPMHTIDDRFRGSNALGRGDVNGDGLADYVTNYEFEQRYVVEFHPAPGANVRMPWPTVVAHQPPPPFVDGQQFDSESAALGDLDGDGNLDIVAAQGGHFSTFWEGRQPGVRVIWGPPAAQTADPTAWLDAGRIPATNDEGHFLWVRVQDLNGDGAPDILAGGRVLFDNLRHAGVLWIEAPTASADRRDLSKWQVHWIDREQYSGHGFILTDVEEDGDLDLADANADFDTPEGEETVHWYENPGTGAPAQIDPWPKHEIYRGSEFYPKPQMDAADLDGDGFVDLFTAVDDAIYWFRKTGLHPVTFERIVIPKPAAGRWRQRPIRVADVNGDGRLDLVGLMTHDDGLIPGARASVFWMEYTGAAPDADHWTLHPIKWGSGTVMKLPSFGEKWDQVDLTDVDGDGDLDIVANCEEWWVTPDTEFVLFFDARAAVASALSVVWFENRRDEPPWLFMEQGGSVALEAEHCTTMRDGTWIERARFPGFAGDGYLHVHNARDDGPRAFADSAGVEWQVSVDGGTYQIWLRRWVPSAWGYGLGGSRSNAAWLAIDGGPGTVVDDEELGVDQWGWVRLGAPVALAPGTHVVNLRARENGYAVDRLVLTTDAGYSPSGVGPAETLWRP